MPIFKTTIDILTKPWEDNLYDENWLDKPTVFYPPTKKWDNSREMSIEDVDIWEVIYQQGGGIAFYVSWSPFAEFYLVTLPFYMSHSTKDKIETYYGIDAAKKVYDRAKDFGITLEVHKVWVEPDDMYLYEKPKTSTLILP